MKKATFEIKNNHILDPDELSLTKTQIHDWIVQIRKNAKDNTLKAFCVSVEAMLVFTSDSAVVKFWKEILSKVDELFMLNAIARAQGSNEAWGETLGKLYQKKVLENE